MSFRSSSRNPSAALWPTSHRGLHLANLVRCSRQFLISVQVRDSIYIAIIKIEEEAEQPNGRLRKLVSELIWRPYTLPRLLETLLFHLNDFNQLSLPRQSLE